jgi:hypothetical protein
MLASVAAPPGSSAEDFETLPADVILAAQPLKMLLLDITKVAPALARPQKSRNRNNDKITRQKWGKRQLAEPFLSGG